MVVRNDSFFVESLRDTNSGDKYCSCIKTNYPAVQIERKATTYDASGNVTGTSWSNIATVPCNVEHVNGNTPYKDGLLLSTTVFRVTTQSSTVIQLLDRFVIDGKPYKADDVNLSVIPGLQVVQLSQDTR